MERFLTEEKEGLTALQVQSRMEAGLNNCDTSVKTKSGKQIIKENVVTLFNILNLLFAIAIFSVGSYKNVTFLGVVICNTLISTFQELHSKKVVDRLSVIASTKATVTREGKIREIPLDQIVLDDVIHFALGNQVVTDSFILSGEVEVNESFITGESDPIIKKEGDLLLSGSFIVSGSCVARVEHVGLANYTAKISKDAKYIKEVNSEIMRSFQKIIKMVSFLLFPMAILLFSKQMSLEGNTLQTAITSTVAALIGMVPEGLVLLTSTVLAVSVMRLAKRNVLVQELYCIETLARVDTICLDKTGTITVGRMEVVDLVPLSSSKEEVEEILGTMFHHLKDENPTACAIRDRFTSVASWKEESVIPFSSKKKYSGVRFQGKGTYYVGAPEFILFDQGKSIEKELKKYTKDYRVVVLTKEQTPLALLLIRDKIRKSANETLQYFRDQGVKIKVISGDNIETVSEIAFRAGIPDDSKRIDATTLRTRRDIEEAVEEYDIFGRVTPSQKKEIVLALKKHGHTVAMTGDGVNDVLALKASDCAVTVASGSDAARNVSQLVLLDSSFDSLPSVVLEGRRTINNIQRSSSLFLVKTIYTTILSIYFLFVDFAYPFEPIQLSFISVLAIGIPSFVLALEPNHNRMEGKFLFNILKKALPAALTIATNIILITILGSIFTFTHGELSTLSVITTAYTAFILLYRICKPFNALHRLLFGTMILVFVLGILLVPKLFSLATFTIPMLIIIAILSVLSYLFYNFYGKLIERISEKRA